MAFLSEIINTSVYDANKERIGRLTDVTILPSQPYPTVSSLIITNGRTPFSIPWSQVTDFAPSVIRLQSPRHQLTAEPSSISTPPAGVHLVRDILDKQIIDIEGLRLIRANDLQLERHNGEMRLVGIDVSGKAIIRRLGLGPLARKLASRLPDTVIPWSAVDQLGANGAPIRLRVSGKALATVHPADLAALVDQLPIDQGSRFVQALEPEVAADTMEEVDPEHQVSLLQAMESDRAADILEAMKPDDAADVLGDLPDEKQRELLSLMEAPEAHEVEELLGYPEDSAGGIMTTECLTFPQQFTAQQVMEELRRNRAPTEMAYYLYITAGPGDERLVGVISLRELILADPQAPLSTFMTQHPITVNVHDHQTDVARTIAKYNLLAVPVANDRGDIQGIVTVDDAIDVILPTAWKKRLPRVFARPPLPSTIASR
ncbi:MAG: CBS domain-containing protein [Chloroflexi bacterium]|nr:CBS domain-containing protein [Chloroflexota bacterium]